MEESRRGRQPPLKVEREFAGSRLEVQILIRAYELASPIIRRRTDVIGPPESFDQPDNDRFEPSAYPKEHECHG